jgi:hypothetical protein
MLKISIKNACGYNKNDYLCIRFVTQTILTMVLNIVLNISQSLFRFFFANIGIKFETAKFRPKIGVTTDLSGR